MAACLAAQPAGAAPTAAVLDEAGRANVARIEAYLDGIRTLRSRFVQIASTGAVAEGELYLARPGRLRIEYRPPVPVEIVANNGWLVYHDTHLGQVSYVPVSSSPAGILVSETLSLTDGELTITGYERGSQATRITVVRTEEPHEGSLTLVFSDPPLSLRKWSITDAQGTVVDVSLIDARFGVAIDDETFRFRNPNFFDREE